MSTNDSIGYVETMGFAAAIQAADIMVKSANVKIKNVANADAGLITVICQGDLASCQAAVDAAKATVTAAGTFVNSNKIPRPSKDVNRLIGDHIGNMLKPETSEKTEKKKASAKKASK